MTDDFFRLQPTAATSWRMAVLAGAETHTYRFALAAALLELAGDGRADVEPDELAVPYAMGLVRRLGAAPQAPAEGADSVADFLAVVARESEESLRQGFPTDELHGAAVDSLATTALPRFHRLRGGDPLPHTFFEVTGGVRLSPELLALAAGEQASGLRAELDARWRIVESSFDPVFGRSLNEQGFGVDRDGLLLTDRSGRHRVTGLAAALSGFQYGRCLRCDAALAPDDDGSVQQVLPGASSRGPDLGGVWNLAPVHTACADDTGTRMPTATELQRLARRNEAAMLSLQPLRSTLLLPLRQARLAGEHADRWPTFLLQTLTARR